MGKASVNLSVTLRRLKFPQQFFAPNDIKHKGLRNTRRLMWQPCNNHWYLKGGSPLTSKPLHGVTAQMWQTDHRTQWNCSFGTEWQARLYFSSGWLPVKDTYFSFSKFGENIYSKHIWWNPSALQEVKVRWQVILNAFLIHQIERI